ncbi:hydroxyneurosporene methyltransferase [Mycobacterium sp. Y57]|uniref:methyltransferase n=1 Tax=Mycolicibacterium xanthum TaxID=2796469 RepID=UPI001C8445A7|nr:methyltransferase [Mycolicibacterium xanthum]MBX7432675.1 hydroxyneurosporene methyltransferase [Mycolicibacterium xanthum]
MDQRTAPPTFPTPPVPLVRALERVRHYLYRLNQKLVPAPLAMTELIMGHMPPQAIAAAAELRLADALADGPLPGDELARRVGANPAALARLLRALISRGIFRELRDGRYALTPLAGTLRSDAPVSLASWARFYGSPEYREFWSLLVDAVRTGQSVVPSLKGTDPFSYLAENPKLAALFNDGMTAISEVTAASIVAAYDFGRFPVIVDVGGGQGRLLAAILAATPSAHGVLYDLPNVVTGAPAVLERDGVNDRVRIEGGSFFASVPAGGDAYVLQRVIHDWDDEAAQTILRNIAAAAPDQATLLLVEMVIPRHHREFAGNWADLDMLVLAEGRERTAEQHRELLRRSGFHLTRIIETALPFCIIEASPIKRDA